VSTTYVVLNLNLMGVGKAGGLHSPFGCAQRRIVEIPDRKIMQETIHQEEYLL
jgi:hypothetical protein